MSRTGAGLGLLLCLGMAALTPAGRAGAQTADAPPPQRPTIHFNRWQEDWSVLANPATPQEAFDSLKYIPLSPGSSQVYLSLGGGLRERYESNGAPSFGTANTPRTDYVISRLEAHADLRLGPRLQVFIQLQSDFAPGKARLSAVDQDRLDLEQAFVAGSWPLAGGELKARVGRQQIAFDLQRFISVRDGPNVRQSYDAAWGDYERGPWRALAFYALPVQNRDQRAFDDYSSAHLTYGGARIEHTLGAGGGVSFSYSRFTQDAARLGAAAGDERRDILDLHIAGAARGFDWDGEVMGQSGRLGAQSVRAWAIGTLGGYTLASLPGTPRIGLQADAASGDSNPRDHRVETFNPLFPNGYYVTLAGYTGYVNFIHLKPSVTFKPTGALKVMLAGAAQWRQTTADAIYTQPTIPVKGSAGQPGRYTGAYGQIRLDWAVNPHVAMALEATHFAVGEVIRRLGGHDSDYLGLEFKYGW
ncbi:MAG: alginate export family protein [Caulobacteraceae bacterium]|nr:alginate export family protein [Caulobacteraceae bacterium]